jgi:hypothetical protein
MPPRPFPSMGALRQQLGLWLKVRALFCLAILLVLHELSHGDR